MTQKEFKIYFEYVGCKAKYSRLLIENNPFYFGDSTLTEIIKNLKLCLSSRDYVATKDYSIEKLCKHDIELLSRHKISVEHCFFCNNIEPIYRFKSLNHLTKTLYICENHLKELIICLVDLNNHGVRKIESTLELR